jgi:hypothetical protein
MITNKTKALLGIQSVILFAGIVFAWSKLIPQLVNFYSLYGTFFRISDCVVPNPFVTACLYGSLAFVAALYWSVRVYLLPAQRSERLLRNFLIFCVIFAGSVVLSEAAEYYHLVSGSVSVTCSRGVAPMQTPCFFGLLYFVTALIVATYAVQQMNRE